MKKISLLFIAAIAFVSLLAQAPEKINYQGVARDNTGNILANQSVGLQIKIRSGSGSGTVVYQENHAVTTNSFGLFNVQIGGGTNTSGNFTSINWGGDLFFIETLMDASGGTSFTSLGTQQLVSVPYSLYSKSSASTAAISGTNNYLPKFTSSNALGNSRIYDDGYYVGIGTSLPGWNLQLHNQASTQNLFQITNANTGTAEGDGLHLGLNTADGNAYLMNQEGGKYLALGSSAMEHIRLASSGYVGIRTANPQWNMQINSPGSETVLQLTAETSTGLFDLDGLLVGINSAGGFISNMENSSLAFSTNATTRMIIDNSGNVGIGTNNPANQLEIVSTQLNPLSVTTNYALTNLGGALVSTITGANNDQKAIRGINNNTPYYGVGVEGVGGWIGLIGEATVSGANTRIGVRGTAGNGNGMNVGVYGIISGNSGTNYAGYFTGDVYSSGNYLPSDKLLKTDVSGFDNALALVNSIAVKKYNYKHDGIYGKMNLPQGTQIGIMADELQQTLPQLVKHNIFQDFDSYLKGETSKENISSIEFSAVNYTGLVPILVRAMQEQDVKILQQQKQIEDLLKRMDEIEKR